MRETRVIQSIEKDRQEPPDIETSSEEYAKRFTGEIGAWFLKVQEEATLKMLVPYPGAEILDVGGGHGQTTHALVRTGYIVTVLGSSNICKTRIEHLLDEKRCTFDVGRLHDLPYPNRAFDVVISYRVLAHVMDWRRYLSEFTRIARYAVIVDFPAKRSANLLSPFLFRVKQRMEGNTRPFISYAETKLVQEFERLGFNFAERFPEFFFPMVLHRVVASRKLSSGIERICRRLRLTNLFGTPVIIKMIRGGN